MEALEKLQNDFKNFMAKQLKKVDDLAIKMQTDFETFKANYGRIFKPKR